MTKSRNCNCFTANLCITNGTVGYVIIRAVVFTIGKDFVFYNDFTCGVACRSEYCEECGVVTERALLVSGVTGLGTGRSESEDVLESVTESSLFICNVGVAAVTGVGGVTTLGTSRSSNYRLVAVACRSEYSEEGGVVTECALLVSSITGLGTGRSEVEEVLESVPESRLFICNVGIITYGTGIGCITDFGTGRSSNYRFVAVTVRSEYCK